jgi:hypothetical protein
MSEESPVKPDEPIDPNDVCKNMYRDVSIVMQTILLAEKTGCNPASNISMLQLTMSYTMTIIRQQKQIDELVKAQNESREQIQALLDYCFTDKSRWKEGRGTQIPSIESKASGPTTVRAHRSRKHKSKNEKKPNE